MTKYEKRRKLIDDYDKELKGLRLQWKYNVITTLEYLIKEDEMDEKLDKQWKEIKNDE